MISNKSKVVNIVGGGLAGTEAAYQLAKNGVSVRLFEMRPTKLTPAHNGGGLAELVCSNSFKSLSAHSAHAGFKWELQKMGSLLMDCADRAKVPAGESLAVDRDVFSKEMETKLLATGLVERITKEVSDVNELPEAYCTIIATGPLTQGGLADVIKSLSGGHGLYFYDAIAPVIDASTINREIVFSASRYGKGSDDYLNCPMNREEYDRFYEALMAAEKLSFQDFEDAKYFQGCQPIEAIAETGKDSLRFGAMKPVGLDDPRTGKRPHAVVQLRIDNLSRTAYNIVGFQTKLKYGEQSKVFRLIPGLENAEFLRLGSMHRNTYICTPALLEKNFSLKTNSKIRFAGQVTGVEGYTESSGVGLLTAASILKEMKGEEWFLPPPNTFTGALCRYIFNCEPKEFQPINVHFGLFPEGTFDVPRKIGKQESRAMIVKQALQNFDGWLKEIRWNA